MPTGDIMNGASDVVASSAGASVDSLTPANGIVGASAPLRLVDDATGEKLLEVAHNRSDSKAIAILSDHQHRLLGRFVGHLRGQVVSFFGSLMPISGADSVRCYGHGARFFLDLNQWPPGDKGPKAPLKQQGWRTSATIHQITPTIMSNTIQSMKLRARTTSKRMGPRAPSGSSSPSYVSMKRRRSLMTCPTVWAVRLAPRAPQASAMSQLRSSTQVNSSYVARRLNNNSTIRTR